jgi:hypothetical protein
MTPDEEPAAKVGDPLPRADEAYIDREKLVHYALDSHSERGRHKAHVFRTALGIERDDADYLMKAILDALPAQPVTAVRDPRHAGESFTWEVLVPIRGLHAKAGRCLNVVTAWELQERPRLVTLRVASRRRQTTD